MKTNTQNIMKAESMKELDTLLAERASWRSAFQENWTLAQPGRIFDWGEQMAVSHPFGESTGMFEGLPHLRASFQIEIKEIGPMLYVAVMPWEQFKRWCLLSALYDKAYHWKQARSAA
jgi:hypothetical protein